MKKVIISSLTVLSLMISNAALSQKMQHHNADEKTLLEARKNHKQRIQQGIKSGELTKVEAKTLTDMEDKIKQAMYKAKNNNNKIDEAERDAIKDLLHSLSSKIDELKSNADKR